MFPTRNLVHKPSLQLCFPQFPVGPAAMVVALVRLDSTSSPPAPLRRMVLPGTEDPEAETNLALRLADVWWLKKKYNYYGYTMVILW